MNRMAKDPGIHGSDTTTGDRDDGSAENLLTIADVTEWHEFWVQIVEENPLTPGTHTVKIWMDGNTGAPDGEFVVTAGDKDLHDYNGSLQMCMGDSDDWGSEDVDFFGYKEGIHPPSAVSHEKASKPNPDDQDPNVPYKAALTWTPGAYVPAMNGHKVYFSENFNDVNDGIGGTILNSNRYPESGTFSLDFSTTYYWRVDEANLTTGWDEGDIWQFTTELFAYAIPSQIITATASSYEEGKSPENTVNGSGLVGDLHSTALTDMWLSAAGEPAPAWIQFDFDKAYKLHEMLVWNYNGPSFLTAAGMKDVVVDYSSDGINWVQIDSVNEFARASGLDDYAPNNTIALDAITAKSVKIYASSNWSGGFADQFGLSEVRFLYIPVHAKQPYPDMDAIDVGIDVTLGWKAGREADKHDVYLDTDEQAVIDDVVPVMTVPEAGYAPSVDLDLASTYYWRIDEVNDAGAPGIWTGDVWNFTTQTFLIVDDFEAYNDIDPPDPESHTIFGLWSDGYLTPTTNGALVGYDPAQPPSQPSYLEHAIVYDGDQSMPLFYNNSSANYSEATVNTDDLAVGRDWTAGSPQTLVLWFHGSPGNAVTERMYVKLNDVEVEYPGDAADIAKQRWKQWNIDLADFGISLNNITELGIGFKRTGASGGAGIVFIDDIRLYRVAPEAPEEIYLEAEAATTLGASWRSYIDPASSGGQHIGSEDGDGNDGDATPGVEWIATYNFTVSDGTYTVVLRAQDAGDDSFWVRIPSATSQTHEDPDQPGTGWVLNDIGSPEGVWEWETVESDDHSDAVVHWTLPAGTHTLEIAKREDGVLLDAILITDNVD